MSSHSHDSKLSRRRFLVIGAGAVAAVPLASVVGSLKAYAQEGDKLAEDNPQAMALGYKHDATEVDTGKYPKRAGDAGAKQFCHNCNLYKGAEGDEWGACSIFPGKLVKADGWCNAWVPKAG
ncbi:MAG: high-potential iron-sulfur protein [Gammaproteobacteria bacterium]